MNTQFRILAGAIVLLSTAACADGNRLGVLFIRPIDRSGVTLRVPGGSDLTTRTDPAVSVNSAHFTGTLLIAGLVGFLTGSLAGFLIALGALLIADVIAGNIRAGRK